jgi:hypothetical protein
MAARLATTWSTTLPNTVPSVYPSSMSVIPLPYVPRHPRPSASLPLRPALNQQTFQSEHSSLSSLAMLFSPPSCVLDLVSARAPQFLNPIHQRAALGRIQSRGERLPVAAYNLPMVMQPEVWVMLQVCLRWFLAWWRHLLWVSSHPLQNRDCHYL